MTVIGDGSGDPRSSAGLNAVGADYFSVLGIAVRDGRAFSVQDREGTEPVAVVSETLARRLWPGSSAIGHRIQAVDEVGTATPSSTWRTVVGVIRDVRQTYDDRDVADIYVPFFQVTPQQYVTFYLKTTASMQTVTEIPRRSRPESSTQSSAAPR